MLVRTKFIMKFHAMKISNFSRNYIFIVARRDDEKLHSFYPEREVLIENVVCMREIEKFVAK